MFIMRTFFSLFLVSLLLLASCTKQQPDVTASPEAFSEYIAAYPSSVIGTDGEIIFRLASGMEDQYKGKNRPLFSFEPEIAGTQIWLDDQTVVFRPSERLESGAAYRGTFHLSQLVETPEELSAFRFRFRTIRQDMEVKTEGVAPAGDPKHLNITGTVVTANAASLADVRQVLTAVQDGRELDITWQQGSREREHRFTVQSAERKEEAGEVMVRWDGTPIGVDAKGSETVIIPSINDFELTGIQVNREGTPHVTLTFSDPLDAAQNLNGLVRIGNQSSLNFIVEENRLRVYPRQQVKEAQTLAVEPGIRSRDGKRLSGRTTREIRLYQLKPQVRLAGKGVIIPDSEELLLPFEAASLGAVDVRVTRIYENNIAQFLQTNPLNGDNDWELNRVGRPVFEDVVPLSSLGSVDAGVWNTYALDLSRLIEPEPGAIYRVEIGFRKHQTLYPCGGDGEIPQSGAESWTLSPAEEQQYWEHFDNFYYPENYNWNERENPCHASYYTKDRFAKRNVLSSDLGLIAKMGETGDVLALVTDLKTPGPKANVTLELYDYQQQLIGTAETDARGMARFHTERDPFLLIAKEDARRGYLRMADGTSLSLSDFDVAGAEVREGIKGFLYGERGVWRPGDSLYVTLILEDQQDVLPEHHPVSFELANPSGQVTDRQVFTQSLNGFYAFRTKTDADAQTGNWSVRAHIGGNTFSKTLKIETVRPNRLKVDLHFAGDRVTASDRTLQGTITSSWLHGATARNLDTDVSMTLHQVRNGFKGYPGYTFDDPSRNIDAPTEEIFEGTLDSQGQADFSYTFPRMKEAPGQLQARLLTRVFEKSGTFSVNRSRIAYYPYDTMVGIRLPEPDTDWGSLDHRKTHTLDVVTLDANGEPVADVPLEMTIYRIDWRWWWEKSEENLSNYFASQNVRPVLRKKLSTDGTGKGEAAFRLDEEWGRFMVRVSDPEGGHAAGETFYLGRSYRQDDEAGGPVRLAFSADRESYQPGDEVTLTIPGSGAGRALISLETGSRILDTWWVETQEEETKVRFEATPEMSPNVYAHVMQIQPHAQQQNDLPIRMYGVIPVSVEDPATELSPVAELPEELRPGTEATFTISEQQGRPMTYTVAVVDEGLLDLTNFRTPDPHSHFYAREALGVKTWDMFDVVAGPYAGSMNRILSIGGDQDIQEPERPSEANRFEPMVRYLGPFHLEAGETNTHTLNVPQYVGSVRTMVIAGQDGAYGQAAVTTPVRKPVMVLGTLPRVLGPGETVDLPVSVFAMDSSVKRVELQVEASDIFSLEGSGSQTLRFKEPGDRLARYQLEIDSRTGAGTVRMTAASPDLPGETARDEIEIAVRNPNPPVVNVYEKALKAGEEWSLEYDPAGLWGTNSGVLELSTIPPIDLARRLGYLIRYPHGSVEHTTSAVFPQLYLDSFTELSDERRASTEENIKAGIRKLGSFRVGSGGLGYWPDHSRADEWGTSYAWHFLLEASRKGYAVPDELMEGLNYYQQERARSWSFNAQRSSRDDLIQAYRLYTLALANTPALGAMNRLRERQELSTAALWRLAAAYALAGQPEAAEELIQGAPTTVPEQQEPDYTYGSETRDQAMILETLSLMKRREQAAGLMRDIASSLNADRWMSTQSTAYSLIAVARFLEIADPAEKVEVMYDAGHAGKGSVSSTAPISQVTLNIEEEGTQRLNVANNSEGTVFARFIQEGTPLIGDTTSASSNLKQRVRYLTPEGDEIDPAEIEQGSDLIAEVTVTNPGLRGDYEDLALTQIFPSGWEIRNPRMDGITFKEPTARPEYQDIRDDRVYTYFDLDARESKTFRVMLNASYLGRFYLPTVSTSALYDATISARTPGRWVEVSLPE